MDFSQPPDAIAIIGLSCRFPGSPNPQAFWQMMCNGVDAITEVPPDRYDIGEFYDPRPATPGKAMSRYGGFLDHVDQFDASFFGISPREAVTIDPQHRLLLEVAWEAMEDAGLIPSSMTEEEKLNIGCFIGLFTGDYWDRQLQSGLPLDVYGATNTARSGAAGRISFSQDLMGTSFAIDAACSSSLLAVDQAVHNLRAGACTTAVAGGVNMILNPDHTIGFSQGQMMAPDGHCKTYDAAADGYVRSEGAGIVILKLLSQAQADGDQIYAVIRGSASNNDGHCDSFMAPSTIGQQAGLRKACRNAKVDPLSISYVEAHGPGTRVGDPAEATTLGEVLCRERPSETPLLVGSVKTNIGHTEGAAGIAGLIKAVLCLKYNNIPPNLHFHTPNPEIPWDKYALKVPTQLTPWPRTTTPRRSVVCSYGIAGTNTYVVLEEAPLRIQQASQRTIPTAHILSLSAQNSQALKDLAQRYIDHIECNLYATQSLQDISYTAGLRRIHHEERLALISNSREDAYQKLKAFINAENGLEQLRGRKIESKRRKIAWIFPGQGSQWPGMGRSLLNSEPVFRSAIEECDRIMSRYVKWSLLAELQAEPEHSHLHEIDVIQPVLFAIEVSLAALWRSWGIIPDAVVGHSMGETAAAYVAGILSLEDAAWIICSRSKLLLRTSGKGAMAVVELSLNEARTFVSKYKTLVSVAVSNSHNSTVLSGNPQALHEILATLERNGVFGRLIKVDVASHSPHMDPLREDLLKQLEHLQPRRGKIPMLSTVRGSFVDGPEMQGSYWVDNLREPVLFLNATQMLLDDGFDTFMEMSPHPILVGAIRQTVEQYEKPALALASMRREEDERTVMLTTLGTLYTHGCEPDWSQLFQSNKGAAISLPTYPWQRQRYWNDKIDRRHAQTSSLRRSDGTLAHPILGIGIPLAIQEKSHCWTTTIDTERFPYLNEHCIHEMSVLPGAAYIELFLAAATETFGAQHFYLENLALKKVLFFPKGVTLTLQVMLTPDPQGKQTLLQLYSRQASQHNQDLPWTLHATALVQQTETIKAQKRSHPLPTQNQKQWTFAMEAATFYEQVQARGVQYGPLFQGITHIWRKSNAAMSYLAIPQEIIDDLSGYQMHPVLMDIFLQGFIPFLPKEQAEDTYVPIAAKQVNFFRKPDSSGRLWSHAILKSTSKAEAIEGDVFLLDEDGQVLLEVLGLRLQSLDAETQGEGLLLQRLNQLLYTLQWEQETTTKASSQVKPGSRWLIFSDQAGIGQSLTDRLQQNGAQWITVTPGNVYKRLQDDRYVLNPNAPEDYHRLFNELFSQKQPLDGIIYLWGMCTTPAHEIHAWQTLTASHNLVSISVVYLLQALTATKKEHSSRLFLVTSGVYSIHENDGPASPTQAPLWGLGRAIVYEHQDLHCTLIDMDSKTSAETLETLYQEIISNNSADELALRGQARYTARLTHHALSNELQQTEHLFRKDGTYLITGGLGGVGLRTAQWMLTQGAQHLVLMGRNGPDPQTKATLQAMRDTGATINLLLADITQEAQLALALTEIRRKMPPLRGIFHSAVVLDDSILLQMDRQRFLKVMAPKVEGTWNLHHLTLNDPLDYFVMFSSASSLIGSPGQSNYAAANAFMDVLAYYRQQQGYPALSINWGRWGEVGQATKQHRSERLELRGFAVMKPGEGLAILGKLLQQKLPQVGVMSFNLQKWSQFYPHLTNSSLFAHLVKEIQVQEETEQRATGSHLTAAMLVTMDDASRHQALIHYLNSQIARVLGHASLNLDIYQQLNRLGIDSLMSVELKNRIRADLSVVIPVTTFLKGVTFEQLITQILEQLMVRTVKQ